jgi:hypothetical protein
MKKTLITILLSFIALGLSAQSDELLSMNRGNLEMGQEEAPVYNGPTGCANPIEFQAFDLLLSNLNAQPFEKDKLATAKQFAESHCLSTSQVKQLMLHFSFEEHRIEFARHAYAHTYDLNNYHKVSKAFKFSSSVEKLRKALNN